MQDDKNVEQNGIPSGENKPVFSPIREKALEGIKLHQDGIKLRDYAVELGVTWQQLLPVLKKLVKDGELQLKDSYYYPKGVEIKTRDENEDAESLKRRFLSYISNQNNGLTLKQAGSDMGMNWQRLLPVVKDLIAENNIIKEENRYYTPDSYKNRTEPIDDKVKKEVPKKPEFTQDRYLSREEARVVDTGTAPSKNDKDQKKHRIGTVEGIALILSVLAFGCFWGWTLPSVNMVGQDQISLNESVHMVYKDLTSVKNMLDQARTDMDIRQLKEIQVILDDLMERKQGNINYQALKIKQDIDQLIKMLNFNKAPK